MQADPATDLDALEQFVLQSEDLLELEATIGRFNIFHALGVARAEIRHSNCLAWLLDPLESHGLGDVFLKAVVLDMLRNANREHRPLSPAELDGAELSRVEIRREWRNIDLLIVSATEPRFVIAIENKIDAGEHSGQLARYRGVLREEFPAVPSLCVFLTPEGDDPSEDEWSPYSYRDLKETLERARRAHRGGIGADVGVFVEHYLSLIGSELMDDPKIDELCQRIYKNHKRAIDLIMERVGGDGPSPLMNAIADFVETRADAWTVVRRASKVVAIAPKQWIEILPPIGRRPQWNPWLRIIIEAKEDRLTAFVRACPTTDPGLRRRVLERLTQDPTEFGLESFFKNANFGDEWATFSRKTLATWDEDEQIDEGKILKRVETYLAEREPHMRAVSRAIAEMCPKTDAT